MSINKITLNDVIFGEWERAGLLLFNVKTNYIPFIVVVKNGRKIPLERQIIGRWHFKENRFTQEDVDKQVEEKTYKEINKINSFLNKRMGLPRLKGYFRIKDLIPYQSFEQFKEIMAN